MTLAALYSLDKQLADLGRRMTEVGFLFDQERAHELSAQLLGLETVAEERARLALGRKINLRSGKQLARAFFSDLGAPVLVRSEKTDAPSLCAEALRAYSLYASPQLRELSLALIDYRHARKLRSTYVDAPLEAAARDGRVHPNWRNYATVSGRFASELQQLPRPEHDPTSGLRALYLAAPGHCLVSFDCSQLEMRIAAYASGDAAMIGACESSDLHAGNAAVIFGAEFERAEGPARAALRSTAKTAGFAICYGAGADSVSKKLGVSLKQAEALLSKLRRAFRGYYNWQESELREIARSGYVYSPICKRRRYLGHEPEMTEASNFPIQSGAADFVNLRTIEFDARLPESARIVAQVHDSITVETPLELAESVSALAHDVFEAPIEINGRSARLPIDLEVSERWH